MDVKQAKDGMPWAMVKRAFEGMIADGHCTKEQCEWAAKAGEVIATTYAQWMSDLSPENRALVIRQMIGSTYLDGIEPTELTRIHLASQFGVHLNTISKAIHRVQRSHRQDFVSHRDQRTIIYKEAILKPLAEFFARVHAD